ncbi:FAD-dependent oxidoreductase [Onishia niordana]|uniref:FAD-dependent oxidoreductase n=1 Tax=Onishia niordana TaxID=2508711 RepID=UPI00109F714B|nr:FAD-dependent oxidoreductase [Halomonas niordiana]
MTAPLTILGTGMAGIQLARQVRARDAARPITLITADSGDDYSKPMLSTGFAKGLPPSRLASRDALSLAESLEAVVRTHTRVTAIDPTARRLALGTETLPYSELVLATGAAPVAPFTIPPGLDKRVFSINDLDDYRAFHAALERLARPARVAIIGSGLVGCEYANDLVAGGHGVTLIAPEPTPLSRLLPDTLGNALSDAFHEAGIALETGHTLAALGDAGDQVMLTLDDDRTLEADLVLVATGLVPRTGLAEAAGLAVGSGGVHTDRYLATSAPGIHALGDVACVDGVNAMYVQPLQVGAKALAATLTGTPTPVTYGPWPILVKTPLLPVVALPPDQTPARWRIEGEGRDWSALAEDENGRMIGFALTGACVRRKVELARAAPALLI